MADTYQGGTVWAPDYWPIMLPFATLHRATAIEVYECDLDYAFGAYPGFVTTNWSTSPPDKGCVPPDSGSPVPGPNTGYTNVLSDALLGLPAATSIRTGNSVLINGYQF